MSASCADGRSGAGNWLTAIPDSPHLTTRDNLFTMALRLRAWRAWQAVRTGTRSLGEAWEQIAAARAEREELTPLDESEERFPLATATSEIGGRQSREQLEAEHSDQAPFLQRSSHGHSWRTEITTIYYQHSMVQMNQFTACV